MELEVGMYVRIINDKAVENGIIGKIKYINEREFKGKLRKYYSVWTNNEDWFEISGNNVAYERIKARHNIIDLIEVGDYVNGYKISAIYDDDSEVNEYNLKHKKCLGKNIYDEDYQEYLIYEEDIKSIVTKEQFEMMSYKVVE